MTLDSQHIRFLRRHIPTFACGPGCRCCGPVTASSEEMARLPAKTEAEHAAALAAFVRIWGKKGCQAYAERPLICRLFGTTPRLACRWQTSCNADRRWH